MKNTFVIDANVILRYLLADHAELFPRARDFLDGVQAGRILGYVPEGVLVECVYVLLKVYAVPRQEIAESLSGVLRYKGIVNDNIDILVEGLRMFAEKNVDVVDAIVHATAKPRGWRSFSFDRDLDKLQE